MTKPDQPLNLDVLLALSPTLMSDNIHGRFQSAWEEQCQQVIYGRVVEPLGARISHIFLS